MTEVHTVTLIALHNIVLLKFLVTEPDERVHFLESSVHLREAYEEQTVRITRESGTSENDLIK